MGFENPQAVYIEVSSLLSLTNSNSLPFSEDISEDIIPFLDPMIEKLYFDRSDKKTLVHIKFKGKDEIIINNPADLELYLSSGTIKGIVTFQMARNVLKSGGYLVVDEIENHFNKEIVATLIRFFMDTRLNKHGGTLIFSTHYPEILDEYDRNDSIYIMRNRDGITANNLCSLLKRNDIKKSEAYESGLLDRTVPAYEDYLQLKKSLAASL
ncbi:MAG: ATP-binding protein [Lachnospiraceae bacterium]|nr:ATP-binding protein [Lachnospiraceae bacterium]